jgi:hypothetical protein
MKRLSTFARFGIMAAMIVALAYEMSQSMKVADWWYDLLLVASFLSAFGFEIVGYLNGHALEGYWRIGDDTRARAAAALLLIYTAVAMHILWDNPALRLLPVVAAIVYFSAPLTEGLETAVSKREQETAENSAFDREQDALDRELARELKRQQQADKTAVKLAQMQARASTEPAQSKPEPAPASYECEDCDRSFGTVQALNAHGRFCPARVPMNGAAK